MTGLKKTYLTKGRDNAEQGRAKKVDRIVSALALVLGSDEAAGILKVAAADAAKASKRPTRFWRNPTNALLGLATQLVDAGFLPANAIERSGKFITVDPAAAALLFGILKMVLALNGAGAPTRAPTQRRAGD